MKCPAVIAGAAVVAALASTAAAAPVAGVTMSLQPLFDPGCRCYKLRFTGTISSGGANEYVVVMAQRCGYTFSTAFGGALTREGRAWQVEQYSFGSPSATYRARWKGRLSEPVRFRGRIPVTLVKLSPRRVRLRVNLYETLQDMAGRWVEFQRLGTGGWTRIRRTRLVAESTGFGKTYDATFSVRTRGLTLRILVPAKSAAPCFTAAATETWTS